jgi:ankyrin repeat protein
LRSHNRTGITPLQLAVVSKTAKKDILCQLLLQNGGDLHKRVEGSPSALQLTAMQGDAELMEVLLQNGANVNNYSALDPGHAFLREKTAVEMLFRLRDSYMYEEEDWIQGARECAQTFLRDTIYRLPAPDPLSIVVSCRDFIGTQGEAWGETSRYDRCGALLQQHGCRGTRFFPRDMTPERAEAALAHGVHSENITIEGFPSLLWAIRNGNAKLCSAFLGDRTTLSADETVEVFQANQFNLIYTLARERPSLCMFNLSQRSSVGQPVLTTAVLNSSPEAMSILKNWASAYDGSKLVLAVKIALVAARNMWLLERLLNNRSQHQEPTNSEGSSIAIAALDAGKGVLDLLLEHLPPVERCDLFNESLDSGFRWEFQYLRRTLLVPVKLRDHGLLEKFLNKGYKADGHVLSGAVETEDLSMVGSILARGLVASLDATGPLPLAVAVLRANISMIQLLLRHGVDVNAEPRAHWGRSALQQAVEIGNLEIIQFLLDRGADVNCPPAPLGGATALQVAAIKGFLGIAKLLLDQDPPANINAPGAGTYGRTALEGAAENGRIDMVQLLLTSGVEATDSQYLRAISLARSCGHDVAAAILEENRELTADKVGALGN